MKRSTLIKRLTPRQRQALLPHNPLTEIQAQTAAAAQALQKETVKLEGTRAQSQKEKTRLAELGAERLKVERETKEKITDLGLKVEHVKAKLKSTEKLQGKTSAAAKELRSELKKTERALVRAKKDQAAATAAAKRREQEEARLGDISEKTLRASREYKALLRVIAKARAAYDAREEALKGKEAAAKERDKQYQAARKKLAFYGKRLAWLYKARGVPLPKAVAELPDLL